MSSHSNEQGACALSVVIPAYNEEKRLPESLPLFLSYLAKRGGSYEVIVVSDGSTDGTPNYVTNISDSHLRLVHYTPNRGKGYAVREGMKEAQGDLILFCDADGATPIEELERVKLAIDAGADLAVGSRAMASQDTAVKTVWYRKIIGRVFATLVNILIVPGISDTQCGFKLFRKELARYLAERQTAERFSFDVELLFLTRKGGFKIAEVPVNWTNVPGSKVNLVADSLDMFLDILKFRWRYLTGKY